MRVAVLEGGPRISECWGEDLPKPSPRIGAYIGARGLSAARIVSAYFTLPGAEARTFPIPPDHPVATIDVPDDWRPISIRDGVEGAAMSGAVRFAAEFIAAPDLDAASAAATAKLKQSGVVVDAETRHAARRRLNGLDALKIDYSGTDPSGESDITIILVALPLKAGFVAVCYWGEDEAQESVSNDLQSIAESVELAK
jgi:hypothetical protein